MITSSEIFEKLMIDLEVKFITETIKLCDLYGFDRNLTLQDRTKILHFMIVNSNFDTFTY